MVNFIKKTFEKSLDDLEENTFPHYQWLFLFDLILLLMNLNSEVHIPFNGISKLFPEDINHLLVTWGDFVFINFPLMIMPIVLIASVLFLYIMFTSNRYDDIDKVVNNVLNKFIVLIKLVGQRVFIYLFTTLLILQGNTFVTNFFGGNHYSTNKIENYWFGLKYNINHYSPYILFILFGVNTFWVIITIKNYFMSDSELKTIDIKDKDFRYTDIIGKKIKNKEYKIIKQNSRKKVLYLLIVSTDKEGLYNVQNKSENFTEITYQFNSIKNYE